MKTLQFQEVSRNKAHYGDIVKYNDGEICRMLNKTVRLATIPDGTPEGRPELHVAGMVAKLGDWVCLDENNLVSIRKGEPPAATQTFGIGHAVGAMKKGLAVTRKGWNGKGLKLMLIDQSGMIPGVNFKPFIVLVEPDGTMGTWAPSISDTLAEDWSLA